MGNSTMKERAIKVLIVVANILGNIGVIALLWTTINHFLPIGPSGGAIGGAITALVLAAGPTVFYTIRWVITGRGLI